jgi:hypothetical protein
VTGHEAPFLAQRDDAQDAAYRTLTRHQQHLGTSICACCQVRACTNIGPNATRIAAKRAGACSMAASPGKDPPGYAHPLRHPISGPPGPLINGQSRT